MANPRQASGSVTARNTDNSRRPSSRATSSSAGSMASNAPRGQQKQRKRRHGGRNDRAGPVEHQGDLGCSLEPVTQKRLTEELEQIIAQDRRRQYQREN